MLPENKQLVRGVTGFEHRRLDPETLLSNKMPDDCKITPLMVATQT